MSKRDLITKDFALYVVHYFASMETWSKKDILAEIDRKIKEADEDVVRCKDCKYYDDEDRCKLAWTMPDEYCSRGEKKNHETH